MDGWDGKDTARALLLLLLLLLLSLLPRHRLSSDEVCSAMEAEGTEAGGGREWYGMVYDNL